MATVRWFEGQKDFVDAARQIENQVVPAATSSGTTRTYPGYCTACRSQTTFAFDSQGSANPNLREGLYCTRCRLNTRQRLMLAAMLASDATGTPQGARAGALLEKTTRLYARSHAAMPWLRGSEYLGEQREPGRSYWWSTRWWRWRRTRHESITALSYANASLDLLAHSDVLEHVYDTTAALRESARVLKPGGIMLFTVPFYVDQAPSILRGRPDSTGRIEHLLPPEYHGDGLRRGGIYTFHHFGWDLLTQMRNAGFARAELGFCHAPGEGFCVDDPQSAESWRTLPLIFRAAR